MSEIDSHLKDISEIRTLMERSSKFLSLSGLSGICTGIVALLGAWIANKILINRQTDLISVADDSYSVIQLIILSIFVLLIALSLAVFFTVKMARKKNYPIWNNTSKWMLASLFVPLSTGGLFCLILVYHGLFFLIPPATLIFYGLSLLNASKYTVSEIRYLALLEIMLGLISSLWPVHSLIFWAIGFGILHILYGTLLYYKYEK